MSDVDLDDFTAFEGGASVSSSPAISSLMDVNGISSSSASIFDTVSPHELLNHGFMSTPNSALTGLTTPSSFYDESPDVDGHVVSPNFGSTEVCGSSTWFSLFPEDSMHKDTQFIDSECASVKAGHDKDSMVERAAEMDSLGKKIKSPSSSGRPSSVAGVNSRRRSKPLSPIIAPDVNDVVAMKRHRNTLAARKSRARKASYVTELEDRLAELEAEVDHWKSLAMLRSASQ